MKIFLPLFVMVVSAACISGCQSEASKALRVSDINPRYFTDGSGKAVYLTGSHTWNNLVDMYNPDSKDIFDYTAFLAFLKSNNHNFFRMWAWDLLSWNTSGNNEQNSRLHHVAPQPWPRTGPGNALDGKPKFDLSKHNPEYFDRMKERIEAAGKENIYVAVMLFEGWGLQFSPGGFRNHPFHPMNNINGIDLDTVNDSKGFAIYELLNDKITLLQEAYVRKVVQTVGSLENVLYEISNENHLASTEWQYHMIRYIGKLGEETGNPRPVGMTFQYRGGKNQTLFDSPADWISPNPEGGYRDNPPQNSGKKVIISDTDHLWGIGGNRKWVWKTFLRGMYPIFMDPYDGKVLEDGSKSDWAEEVRVAMGHTRKFAERLDLIHMVPAVSVSSSGYCLANIGKEYLVYLPEDNEVEVDLLSDKGIFHVEWFNPSDGSSQKGNSVKGGQKIKLVSPFASEDALLYIY